MRVAVVGESTSKDDLFLAVRELHVELTRIDQSASLDHVLATQKVDAVLWLGQRGAVARTAYAWSAQFPHVVHAATWQVRDAASLLAEAANPAGPVLILSDYEPLGVQIRRELALRPGYADTRHILHHLLANRSRIRQDEFEVMQRIFLDQDSHLSLESLCANCGVQRRLNRTAHALGIRSMHPCMRAVTAIRAFVERTTWAHTVKQTVSNTGHDRHTVNRHLDGTFGTHNLKLLGQRGMDWIRKTALASMMMSDSQIAELPPLDLPAHPAQAFRRVASTRSISDTV